MGAAGSGRSGTTMKPPGSGTTLKALLARKEVSPLTIMCLPKYRVRKSSGDAARIAPSRPASPFGRVIPCPSASTAGAGSAGVTAKLGRQQLSSSTTAIADKPAAIFWRMART